MGASLQVSIFEIRFAYETPAGAESQRFSPGKGDYPGETDAAKTVKRQFVTAQRRTDDEAKIRGESRKPEIAKSRKNHRRTARESQAHWLNIIRFFGLSLFRAFAIRPPADRASYVSLARSVLDPSSPRRSIESGASNVERHARHRKRRAPRPEGRGRAASVPVSLAAGRACRFARPDGGLC
jgi:hypothetical protein